MATWVNPKKLVMIDRYSNPEINSIWTLETKFKVWLEIEVAVCEAWNRRGMINDADLKTIKEKAGFDLKRIDEIEAEVQHDVIAFLTSVKEHIGPAGRFVHYGLTSSDVGDTALCLQMVRAADIILNRIDTLLDKLKIQIQKHRHQIMIGRTHGIHAEPTTLGLKLATYYAELQRDKERLISAREDIAVGKLSGAVGTFSNIDPIIEEEVCKSLGLQPDPISTQVISRDRHANYLSVMGIIAGTLDRLAQEVRLLQKTEGREIEEPFAKGQKGSSAMPHKRNPVICERICGLARVIQGNVQSAYRNMPLWHERDISHSSAERVIIPDSTIALEYILGKAIYVVENLHVYPESMDRVLKHSRGLIFSQRLLLALVDKGLEREESYKIVQTMAMDVWADSTKTVLDEAKKHPSITDKLSEKELSEIFSVDYFLRNIETIFRRLGL